MGDELVWIDDIRREEVESLPVVFRKRGGGSRDEKFPVVDKVRVDRREVVPFRLAAREIESSSRRRATESGRLGILGRRA
jgi:hypothetical protein